MENSKLQKMEVRFFISEERAHDGIVIPKLVHGDTILSVETGQEDLTGCDAVISENLDLELGITTADCASACFSDGTKIAIVHAGWRGLCLGILEKMLLKFDSNEVEVFVGPHLFSFEIQKDTCYDTITAKFGEKFFAYEDGKIIFRFKDAIASCLPQDTIFDERNTGIDLSLPSYRRDKTIARIVTVVQCKK